MNKQKDFLVIFTKDNGARIEKDPEYVKLHKNDPNTLFNPEIPKGTSPSTWTLKDGKISSGKIKHEIEKYDFVNEKNKRHQDQNFKLKIKLKRYKIAVILIILATIGHICQVHL